MFIADIEELAIQYDGELQLLWVEWAAGRQMAQLRPAAEQLQQVALRLQPTSALLDLSCLADLSVYDQIWLGTHWMPTVLQLPLKQVVVVQGSERVYNMHAIEVLLNAFRRVLGFEVHFFTQVVPGLQWLTDNSPRLPQLVADWQAARGAGAGPTVVTEPLPSFRLK